MRQTSLEDVRRIANSGDYKLIPIKREIFSDIRTPLETLRALQNVSNHCFLLESCEDNRQWGRYSFLGYAPDMTITSKDHELTIVTEEGSSTTKCDNPSEYIKKIVEDNKAPQIEGFPTFTGGLVGYFCYEYMQYGEPSLSFKSQNENDFNDMDLMLFRKIICYDNLKQKILLIANVSTKDLENSYNEASSKIDEMEHLIRGGLQKPVVKGRLRSELVPKFDKAQFCEKIEKVKYHIKEGDVFQLVLSNPMEAEFEGSLLNTYRVLRTTNPSPYMFYFYGDMEIAGASPETLVKVTDKTIRTFPLAGTRPRGATYEEDQALEKELLADEKERAEHNMLVDLGRNDLGRLCKFGSVEVEKYMEILYSIGEYQ